MTPLAADRRRFAAALLAGAALWPAGKALAVSPDPPPLPGALPPTTGAGSTSIGAGLDWSSRMTAPVFIEGQGPYPFVVDTGANRTVIDGPFTETKAVGRAHSDNQSDEEILGDEYRQDRYKAPHPGRERPSGSIQVREEWRVVRS